jgi:hypothetical protein
MAQHQLLLFGIEAVIMFRRGRGRVAKPFVDITTNFNTESSCEAACHLGGEGGGCMHIQRLTGGFRRLSEHAVVNGQKEKSVHVILELFQVIFGSIT